MRKIFLVALLSLSVCFGGFSQNFLEGDFFILSFEYSSRLGEECYYWIMQSGDIRVYPLFFDCYNDLSVYDNALENGYNIFFDQTVNANIGVRQEDFLTCSEDVKEIITNHRQSKQLVQKLRSIEPLSSKLFKKDRGPLRMLHREKVNIYVSAISGIFLKGTSMTRDKSYPTLMPYKNIISNRDAPKTEFWNNVIRTDFRRIPFDIFRPELDLWSQILTSSIYE
ncbi:MAG: hypothetical protein IJ161_01210 [Bacteroidales bacterium]|nr:hypothetical protein [Bacteroidales bacterium]